MLVTQTISWPAATWPSTSTATQYAIFQTYPTSSGTPIATTSGSVTSASITYDDTQASVFQIRPTNGTNYGSEVIAYVVGYVPCRGWLRQRVRYALADQANGSTTVKWSDDEINGYVEEAINELSVIFPKEEDTTITLLSPQIVGGQQVGVRAYAMPIDCAQVRTVEYITIDGLVHLYLKEKPFRGGESTATTYLGYPKLGIMLQPMAGRFYPGHYDVYENTLFLDWDPAGNGDTLHIRYAGRYPIPTDDATLFTVQPEDLELLSLYTQMKCWMRVEGQDASLSRWRTK